MRSLMIKPGRKAAGRLAILALCGAGAIGPRAGRAANYDMYRTDYAKGAFCAAIAGACASDDNPENSFFQNPAALVSGEPDLIYDGDFNPSDNLEPGMKVSDTASQTTFMGGFAKAGSQWGAGLSFSGRLSEVKAKASLLASDRGDKNIVDTDNSSTTVFVNLPVARRIDPRWSVGMALVAMVYQESFGIAGSPNSGTSSLDKFPQVGFAFGALYDNERNFRFGSWLRTPITYYVSQSINQQVGTTLIQVSEDIGLHYPLIFANGVSWMPWEDKRTVFFDLDLIGTTPGGLERTLDTFATISNAGAVLRPKGTSLALEPHLAWRAPWWRGSKGTYTFGTYYENSRWQGISGRVHGVASLAYKAGLPVVGEMEYIGAIDMASDYFALQLSFR